MCAHVQACIQVHRHADALGGQKTELDPLSHLSSFLKVVLICILLMAEEADIFLLIIYMFSFEQCHPRLNFLRTSINFSH